MGFAECLSVGERENTRQKDMPGQQDFLPIDLNGLFIERKVSPCCDWSPNLLRVKRNKKAKCGEACGDDSGYWMGRTGQVLEPGRHWRLDSVESTLAEWWGGWNYEPTGGFVSLSPWEISLLSSVTGVQYRAHPVEGRGHPSFLTELRFLFLPCGGSFSLCFRRTNRL